MFLKMSPTLAFVLIALVATVGCNKSTGESTSPSVNIVSEPGEINESPAPVAVDPAAYVPGTAAHSAKVVSLLMYAEDGTLLSEADLVPLFGTYTVLAAQRAELATIDRFVLTTDSRLELYAGADLAMVVNVANESAEVVWVRADFKAESVAFIMSQTDQSVISSALRLNLKSCVVPEKEVPDQDQSKDKDDKVVEPVCLAMSAILVAQETLDQKQDDDKGQDKDQGKN